MPRNTEAKRKRRQQKPWAKSKPKSNRKLWVFDPKLAAANDREVTDEEALACARQLLGE